MALILSLRVFLITGAVVFTAVGLKASLPLVTTHIPLIWSFCIMCFKPPYLYVIFNAIIISILASINFHNSNHPLESTPPPPYDHNFTTPEPVLEVKAVLVDGSPELQHEQQEEEQDKTIDIMEETLKRMDSPEYLSLTEKPLVSARFGHRKHLKSTPEGGRSLRVAKPKRQETLENTWKAITEGRGRAMPLSRHVKKCDTWKIRGSEDPHEHEVKKWETFKDRTNQQLNPVSVSASPPKLRKDPSLSQDELNRRVEAFIRKFNEQMRLQRQESLNQYMQTINRGAT